LDAIAIIANPNKAIVQYAIEIAHDVAQLFVKLEEAGREGLALFMKAIRGDKQAAVTLIDTL
jgi:hypothetical protein